MTNTLYARLGGYDAVAAVAENLLPRLTSDPQLGRFWKTAATKACIARSSFSLTSCVQPPVIADARLSDREPYAYLKYVLERRTNGHPASRLDDLLEPET
jgi:hypothetical protein